MGRWPSAFRVRYGPWAVVAGASEGLGAEYATQLAALGLNVVAIARREALLRELADRLTTRYGVQVRPLAVDLARTDAAVPALTAATADLEIGLLVYNAARSVIGPFFDASLEAHLGEVALNCAGPLTLAYLFGKQMLARGHGGIVLMSSLSATMGSALIANYAATKAYNLVLAEGIWEELRTRGVDVMACAAGAVATPGYVASAPKGGSAMAPERVVAETLAALGSTPSCIPGRSNQFSAFVLRRLLPRSSAIRLMGRVMRGMYETPPS